jgi:hypothetical protein
MEYLALKNSLKEAMSSANAILIWGWETAFISNVFKCMVIDSMQLGCPELDELIFRMLGCTSLCHNKSHYVSAMSKPMECPP